MIASFPERRFQFWEYSVSHGSLLIRSPKAPTTTHGPTATRNIDLMFVGVEFVQVARFFEGMILDVGTAMDRALVGRSTDRSFNKVFALVSGGKRYIIAAAGHKVSENDDDIFASPFP